MCAILRYAAVGKEHKLLDKLVCLLLHLGVYAEGSALVIETEAHLIACKGYRAMLEAVVAQLLCKGVECEYLLFVVALASLDNLLRLLIGEAAVGVDDGASKPLILDLGILVECEYGREAELILVGA